MKENAMKIGSIAVIGLLLLGGFGILTATVPDNARASWYNVSWGRRTVVTISNPEPVNFLNTTVLVQMAPGAAFWNYVGPNGYDVRFVQSNDITSMSYYVQNWDYLNERAAWLVRVNNLTASSTTTFYLYYSNILAIADVSSGTSTFEMFDDFEYSGFRNITTDGFSGNGGGTIYQKTGQIYQPDPAPWATSQQDMMGITICQNSSTEYVGAYGTYVNASYAVIVGMDSATGYSGWTDYNNILLNHSAPGGASDTIKVCEPHFLTNMTNLSSNEREPVSEYLGSNYCMYYTGLNSTNYSVNLAYTSNTGPIDTPWTKLPANPVLWNGSGADFDSFGVRSPVTWRNNLGWYSMLYAGIANPVTDVWHVGVASSADMVTWTKNYSFAVFNGSGAWGWDNCSVFPQDIQRTQDGTWWEMLYAGVDCWGNASLGVAYTSDDDLAGWVTWAGILGKGEGMDYDDTSVRYCSWGVIHGYQWLIYDVGTNSTGKDAMGMNNVFNSTDVVDGGVQGLQQDGLRQAGYHITTDGALKCWWNGTMLQREVGFANYTAGIDFWTGYPVSNITIFEASSGDYYGNSEDYYGATVDTVNFALNTSEMTAGADAILSGTAFTVGANFTHYLVSISQYGDDIWANGLDRWGNAVSNHTIDATKTTGEIGFRMDSQTTVYFDNFRATGTSNGTVNCTLGATTLYTAPAPGGSTGDTGGGDDDTPPVDDSPPADNEDGGLGCCGITGAVIGTLLLAVVVQRRKSGGIE
jgi:hypothetical protein